MKVGIAQTKAIIGDIEANIANHKKWIDCALSEKADLIFFPELSLTGYEPRLADTWAMRADDLRWNEFQTISDLHKIVIGVGAPTRSEDGVCISMIIFQPDQTRQMYSKQILHADEYPYFVKGNYQLLLTIKDVKIAPAICYESLQPEHAEAANKLGTMLYLASVAKSKVGVEKATVHYSAIAKKYSMPVLMSNSVGPCDTFESIGQSSVWDGNGTLLASLDAREGMLIFNKQTNEVKKVSEVS